MPRRSLLLTATLLGAMCLPASLTLAQQADTGGGNNNGNNSSNNDRPNTGGDQGARGDRGGNGGPPGGNRWDPAQMRQRMEDMMKQQLGTNDDEWKIIQPKLQKVLEVQRDARGGGMGGMFGRNRPGGDRGPGGDTQATSPVQQAQRDLRTALDNKDTPADQITAKLTALREAREKAKADLSAAQKDLREVLTQRQEAVLVMMGMLD